MYYFELKKLNKYLLTNNYAIFGRKYSNLFEMGANTNFLNALWSGEAIKEIENKELTVLLKKLRSIFIFQIIYSVSVFFILMVSAQIRLWF
jgi:hypothetical protein